MVENFGCVIGGIHTSPKNDAGGVLIAAGRQ